MTVQPTDNRLFTYRIDRMNRIVDINDAWIEFALENDAPTLVRNNVIGKSLWDFIDGWETRHMYDLIFDRIRKNRGVVRLPFRCDAPSLRRFMEMEILTFPCDDIQFCCRILREEPRPPVDVQPFVGDQGEAIICTWCKKLRVKETLWQEAEAAIGKLELFVKDRRPKLLNQVCPDCRKNILKAIAAGDESASSSG